MSTNVTSCISTFPNYKPTVIPVIVESSRHDWMLGTSMITLELSCDLSWSFSVSSSSLLLLSGMAGGDGSGCCEGSSCFWGCWLPLWLWFSGGWASPPSLLSSCLKIQRQRRYCTLTVCLMLSDGESMAPCRKKQTCIHVDTSSSVVAGCSPFTSPSPSWCEEGTTVAVKSIEHMKPVRCKPAVSVDIKGSFWGNRNKIILVYTLIKI